MYSLTSFETKKGELVALPTHGNTESRQPGPARRHRQVTVSHCPSAPPAHPRPACPPLHGPAACSASCQGSWRQTPPPSASALHPVWHPPWHAVGAVTGPARVTADAEQALPRPRCITTLLSQQRPRAENGASVSHRTSRRGLGGLHPAGGSQEENRPRETEPLVATGPYRGHLQRAPA